MVIVERFEFTVFGAIFAVAASIVVFRQARSRYGSLVALAAILIGDLGAASTFLVLQTMPSHRRTTFWDDWLDYLRWDWHTAQTVGFAFLFSPIGILASVVSLETYRWWIKR